MSGPFSLGTSRPFKSPPRGSPLYWVAAIISRHGGGEAAMDVEDCRSLITAVMCWVHLLVGF